jgi:hypothetical protein
MVMVAVVAVAAVVISLVPVELRHFVQQSALEQLVRPAAITSWLEEPQQQMTVKLRPPKVM